MPIRSPWSNEIVKFDNKGLDLIHAVDQVDEQHYSRFINVKSVQEGSLQPRPGSSLVNAAVFESGTFPLLTEVENSGNLCAIAPGSPIDTYGTEEIMFASTANIVKWITLSWEQSLPPSGNGNGEWQFQLLVDDVVKMTDTYFQITQVAINHSSDVRMSFPFSIAAGSKVSIKIKDEAKTTGALCLIMHLWGS